MKIIQIIRQIKKKIRQNNPLIRVFVFRKNIIHNLQQYQSKFKDIKFSPVLKSNAYGHGLVEVAKILENQNIEFLIVDSIFEARILRNAGIKSKILIIGFVWPEEIIQSKIKNISYTITSLEQLRTIDRRIKSPRLFHFKFDTGMHRQGMLVSEKEKVLKIAQNNKFIRLQGICSHLADADSADERFTLGQIEEWNNIVKYFSKISDIKYYHLAATPGVRYLDKIDCNMVRLGYGLYGVNPFGQNMDLRPALRMTAPITLVKEIKKGDKVGYNTTFEAQKDMKIATIPVGYFEGIDRRLSNKGFVKVRDRFCPIIGRVSMNISSIDVSEIPNLKIGEEVVIISENPKDKNSIEKIAEQSQAIVYEILVHIPQHLKREVI